MFLEAAIRECHGFVNVGEGGGEGRGSCDARKLCSVANMSINYPVSTSANL